MRFIWRWHDALLTGQQVSGPSRRLAHRTANGTRIQASDLVALFRGRILTDGEHPLNPAPTARRRMQTHGEDFQIQTRDPHD